MPIWDLYRYDDMVRVASKPTCGKSLNFYTRPLHKVKCLIINYRSQKAARAGVCDESVDTLTIRDRYIPISNRFATLDRQCLKTIG